MASHTTTSLWLLIIAILNVGYLGWRAYETSVLDRPVEYSYHGHDFPEELPLPNPLSNVDVVLEESIHYLPLGNTSENAWRALAFAGNGYVRLGPNDRIFSISMFHEMHCLRIINRAFTKTTGATPTHLKHCLNYIRQNILCSPDLALEPGDFERRDFDVERVGGTHSCKNWDTVYQFTDANYHAWKARTGSEDMQSYEPFTGYSGDVNQHLDI